MTFLSNFSKKMFKKNEIPDQPQKTIDNSFQVVVEQVNKSSSKDGSNFKFEYGRRFHANEDVSYILPNDDDENDRVHHQHWVLKLAIQGNFHAPVTEMLENGINVLDSGCGPATWTFDMAKAYPQSKFYGIDAARVFPEDIKPSNVELVIGNIANRLPYPDNYFDYVHQRLLVLGLSQADWDNSLKEMMRVLKPGGYIELIEFGPELDNEGPLLNQIQEIVSNMLIAKKMPKDIAYNLEDVLSQAGYINCVNDPRLLNMNHNGKVGELFWNNYRHVVTNMKAILAMLNPEWSEEGAFEKYMEACSEEAKNLKSSVKYYACYAQKPFE